MSEKDINDAFADILFTEERIIEESYQKGLEEGAQQGNPEGYHLGYHRGAEIGAELGYYIGIIDNFNLDNLHAAKVLHLLGTLKTQISQFPSENTEEDYLGALTNIRAAYKKVCALLKLDGTYPEADKLQF